MTWFYVLKLMVLGSLVIGTILAFLSIILLIMMRSLQPYHGKRAYHNQKAIVVQEINPEGYIKVLGEIWQARSYSGETIASGRRVVVLEQEGLELLVEPVNDNH